MYRYADYFDNYGRIMQFNKNKSEPIHRWYPFVEGYSREFIMSIINELNYRPTLTLEPFSGSGTTALELQNLGIKCISFEVNPHMYLLSKVKLRREYDLNSLITDYRRIIQDSKNGDCLVPSSVFSTLYENQFVKKWNINAEVGIAIENIKASIAKLENDINRDLFLVALSSILLDVSNLYRNGKCLSYKKNWNSRRLSTNQVYEIFEKKVIDTFFIDIANFNQVVNHSEVSNIDYLHLMDSRFGIGELVEDNSVDLVITSPPYLNSRDYTDTYMLELKTLGYTKSLMEISDLRKSTMRSHVQISWDVGENQNIEEVNKMLIQISEASKDFGSWNPSICKMIELYFVDINRIFNQIYKAMKFGGMVFFNVSNSAYFNQTINTIELSAKIAESNGFEIIEIRRARYLKTSPQQQQSIGKLLEAVIVMRKQNERN